MGRRVIVELKDGREIATPARHGMLYDSSGKHWPDCSLLLARFEQGSSKDDSSEGKDYFGRKAVVFRGEVSLPPKSLSEWKEVGVVSKIFYERAGTKAPGRFRHEFHKPRGLWRLIFLLKGGMKEPVVLYKHTGFFRLELPPNCQVDDRGIAAP